MNFDKNLIAGLNNLPIKKMAGKEKFVATAAFLCKGSLDIKIKASNVKANWKKSIFKIKYNPIFYIRAIAEEWVNPINGSGQFTINKDGYKHILSLAGEISTKELRKTGSLIIFNKKSTNTFDVYLKNVLSSAKRNILIVDSYIDGSLFDDIFTEIPRDIPTKLIYGNIKSKNINKLNQRVKRYSKEWPKFALKKYKGIHDRFIIIDSLGYILGPSIKDAADRSHAILVILNTKETALLTEFFNELWKTSK